ncbi:MAG: signal peptidase I [Clostridia bacterium]|nr:signal peptidase I [Clostridia bacterium]
MIRAIIKVRSIAATVLLAITVLTAALLAGIRILGLTPYAVLSGSMEPEYPVGSLLYVKKVDPAELKVGDDITFLLDSDTAATHRIVAVVPDGDDPSVLRFKTKGIANKDEDGGLVHAQNIMGKPVFNIPYLGYISVYIQNPPGVYFVISAAVILLAVGFWPDFGKKKAENSRKCPES